MDAQSGRSLHNRPDGQIVQLAFGAFLDDDMELGRCERVRSIQPEFNIPLSQCGELTIDKDEIMH